VKSFVIWIHFIGNIDPDTITDLNRLAIEFFSKGNSRSTYAFLSSSSQLPKGNNRVLTVNIFTPSVDLHFFTQDGTFRRMNHKIALVCDPSLN